MGSIQWFVFIVQPLIRLFGTKRFRISLDSSGTQLQYWLIPISVFLLRDGQWDAHKHSRILLSHSMIRSGLSSIRRPQHGLWLYSVTRFVMNKNLH